ncbi:MAG TPA: MlaD family protein [Spirochaetota bacterium]|nr:MlaD family protein [Spirochaetota bacterium]
MKLSNEARVGMLVTVSFTIFIVLVGILAKINIAQSGYNLRIHFGFLGDLRKGAPVKIAGGINIGQVIDIKQSGQKSEVKVWIDKNYRLIKKTRFAIFTTGIIGEKYINVFVPPSVGAEEYFQDGDMVYGIDPPSFDQMMLTFQGFLGKEGSQILAEIFENSNKFVGNLNKMTYDNQNDVRHSVLLVKTMMQGLSTKSLVLMDQLNHFTKNMADISERNKQDITIALQQLSETTSNMNKIIYRIEHGRGTLGKLLTDEEVYNNLREASRYARDLFYSLKQDPSKLFFRPKQ